MRVFVIALIILHLSAVSDLFGQASDRPQKYPVSGSTCPDFLLTDIRNYRLSQASLKDFKGKWLLLDFWSKGCSGCIKEFPKLNAINEKYKVQLQVMLIGQNTMRFNKDIDVLFEKIKVKQQLSLPIAYDSVVFEQFGIMGVPTAVIIDPDGIVKAVTYGVTSEKIDNLLNGIPVYFTHKPNTYEADEMDSIKKHTPQIVERLDEMLAGSYISPWKNQTQNRSMVLGIGNNLNKGYFNVTGSSLIDLYKYAYVGRCSWWNDDSLYHHMSQFPVFEVTDPNPFAINYDTGEGGYNYYLRTPVEKASVSYFQQIMRKDLKQLFGYEVSLEQRQVDCWRLTASEDARKKLATRNGSPRYYEDIASLQLVNVPVKSLISFIGGEQQFEPIILDDTGISTNIDISMEVMLTDLNDIKRELERHGLRLEKGTTEMTVMVFRDAAK